MEVIFFIIAIIIYAARNSNSENYDWVNRPFDNPRSSYGWGTYYPNEGWKPKDPMLVLMTILVLFAFFIQPVIGIILIPVCVLAYRQIKKMQVDKDAEKRRKEALSRARVFLLPYKDIWKNLTLSNKYCSLKLKIDGKTIVGTEKKSDPYLPYRFFKITASQVFDNNELWNLFCINFSYNKSYNGLLEDCNRYKASIYEDIVTPQLPKPEAKTVVDGETVSQIDVNNCSEAELTALPGISIVIAKKIIKKREEIGGFKNISDFLLFVKLRPNVSKQLEPKICVKKMKGNLKYTRNNERTLDL